MPLHMRNSGLEYAQGWIRPLYMYNSGLEYALACIIVVELQKRICFSYYLCTVANSAQSQASFGLHPKLIAFGWHGPRLYHKW